MNIAEDLQDGHLQCQDLTTHSVATQAPMLYCGEQIGNGTLEPQVDIAVDPLDGTTSIALVGLLTQV